MGYVVGSQRVAKARPVQVRPASSEGQNPPAAEWPDWIPAGMKNGVPGAGAVVHQLVVDGRELEQLQRRVRARVDHARGLGVSWGVVGLALGISAEGARSRYGRGRP
jgi:hypothetical protein